MDNSLLLVDFLNVYCNFIKFHINGQKTESSFIKCIKNFTKNKNKKILVSKFLYEIDIEVILDITRKYPYITYIMVIDENENESKYKERDDYTLINLYHTLSNKYRYTSLLTNDRFKNYDTIVSVKRRMKLFIVKNGRCSIESLDNDIQFSGVECLNILRFKFTTNNNLIFIK
jgi:hypothetical protein